MNFSCWPSVYQKQYKGPRNTHWSFSINYSVSWDPIKFILSIFYWFAWGKKPLFFKVDNKGVHLAQKLSSNPYKSYFEFGLCYVWKTVQISYWMCRVRQRHKKNIAEQHQLQALCILWMLWSDSLVAMASLMPEWGWVAIHHASTTFNSPLHKPLWLH